MMVRLIETQISIFGGFVDICFVYTYGHVAMLAFTKSEKHKLELVRVRCDVDVRSIIFLGIL